jgi:hypothetical protein
VPIVNGQCLALLAAAVFSTVAAPVARAQSGSELAGQVVNPFTSTVKVPVQLSYDKSIGPANGGKAFPLNIQPLIPFALDADWDIISRTILAIVTQKDIFPGAGSQSGAGDTLQSFFISPQKVNSRGVDWGLGAAVLLPTATNDLLGSKKWALGPTGGVFRDAGPWTVGILANHIWSAAGSGKGGRINSTFLQPVLSYTTSDAWSYTLQTEAAYDRTTKQWSVPIEGSIGKLKQFGSQQVNLEAGVHYWVPSPESGPKRWGFSFTTTLLFPK